MDEVKAGATVTVQELAAQDRAGIRTHVGDVRRAVKEWADQHGTWQAAVELAGLILVDAGGKDGFWAVHQFTPAELKQVQTLLQRLSHQALERLNRKLKTEAPKRKGRRHDGDDSNGEAVGA